MSNLHDFKSQKGFKIVHLNIRSLIKKIETSKIDIFTISETWLTSNHSSSLVNLRNYNFIRYDRQTLNVNNQTKHGGGLGIYIHDTIDYDLDTISHYNVSNRDIEAQWVVIKRNHCKKIILCNVYRPPEGNVDIALETLTNSLSIMPDLDKSELVLLGDLNVDVAKQNDPGTKKIKSFLTDHNLRQEIVDSTRNTLNTSTTIDLIMTNMKFCTCRGTLDYFISDHQPVFIIKKKAKSEFHKKIEFEG